LCPYFTLPKKYAIIGKKIKKKRRGKMKIVKLVVGDILTMKKNHPCGCDTLEVMRVGSDIRIKCTSCGRDTVVPRVKLEKNIRAVNGEKLK